LLAFPNTSRDRDDLGTGGKGGDLPPLYHIFPWKALDSFFSSYTPYENIEDTQEEDDYNKDQHFGKGKSR